MNKTNQCEHCMNLDYDEVLDEDCCTVSMDQDEVAKIRYDRSSGCPYFRMGDDYTIMRKQGF